MTQQFRRVLVTGGAGFIGSNYVRYALQNHPDWSIVVLDLLTYASSLTNLAEEMERITFIKGDIADPQQVKAAVEGVDAILNFAAESHVDRSLLDPGPFVRTNVEGTLVLLKAALATGVKRFLQVSTDEVYGDVSGTPRHSLETDPLYPGSPYAATKAGAEHLVFAYGISYGLDVVISRGSNTYGPYQYPEKIIPLFITNALTDQPLPLYGDGSALRDYLYVMDHCSGIDHVLHFGVAGQAYNLGARYQISGVDVAAQILHRLGKSKDLIQFVPDRPGHDYRYSVDPSAAEALNWQRQWTFETGLQQTVDWYRSHPQWWSQIKAQQEFQQFEARWYRQRR
jgi:dTDP-glucose 4,6-dehydratase